LSDTRRYLTPLWHGLLTTRLWHGLLTKGLITSGQVIQSPLQNLRSGCSCIGGVPRRYGVPEPPASPAAPTAPPTGRGAWLAGPASSGGRSTGSADPAASAPPPTDHGRVGGGVAPAASHRSGRARLRHPARQTTDSHCPLRYPLGLRGQGSRRRCTGPVAPQRVRSPAPPSLHRVPAAAVPRLPRYYGALRFPANRHDGLPCRSPVLTTRWRLSSSLPSGPTPAGGPGALRCGRPHAASPVESQGVSSSWGTLMRLCRVLRPRRDRAARLCGGPTRPPIWRSRRLPAGEAISGLHSTA
jgi:hypothetical protein